MAIFMDCSSPAAMQNLAKSVSNLPWPLVMTPDADRRWHCRMKRVLMNPNHYLCVAVDYLLKIVRYGVAN